MWLGDEVSTIAAIATPPGRGGVGIVRVSGSWVPAIIRGILNRELHAREASFCRFLTADQKVIDEGVAIYFSAPKSFTGEEVLELHGHGGKVVMELLLQRVLELGAKLARPGEFIERAFLNHKLDLVQVEAAADLINAASEQAAQNATRSLQGEFSLRVNQLTAQLTSFRAQVEATIDFTEELAIEEEATRSANNAQFRVDLENLLDQIKQLKASAKQGRILREGITVVIAGGTNTGKSSLFNYLSAKEAAIVTDIPGTTRDVLCSWIQIDGLPINLLDTAGLRENPDLIEAEGIRRARKEIKRADQVLLMVDAAATSDRDAQKLGRDFLSLWSPRLHHKGPRVPRLTILYNKIDLTGEEARVVRGDNVDYIYLSVKAGKGLDLLKQYLKDITGFSTIGDGFSARERHVEALARTEQCLQLIVEQSFLELDRIELVAEELKKAQNMLSEITGTVSDKDVLDKIFAEFCVGK